MVALRRGKISLGAATQTEDFHPRGLHAYYSKMFRSLSNTKLVGIADDAIEEEPDGHYPGGIAGRRLREGEPNQNAKEARRGAHKGGKGWGAMTEIPQDKIDAVVQYLEKEFITKTVKYVGQRTDRTHSRDLYTFRLVNGDHPPIMVQEEFFRFNDPAMISSKLQSWQLGAIISRTGWSKAVVVYHDRIREEDILK